MKTRYFLIYRSPSHSYLCFLLIAFPLFTFWLAGETRFSFLYMVAVFLLPLCLGFLAQLCAFLRIDEKGVRLIRLFDKSHALGWEEIRYYGALRIPYYGSSASAEIFYFSRKPVAGDLTVRGTLPRLTEDFLFATTQPGLAEAIGHYLP